MRKYKGLLFISILISINGFTQNNQPLKLPENLNLIKDINYADNNNPVQALDIFIPKNKEVGKLPALVYIHGGGWKGGDKNQALKKLTPFLNDGEYVGISVNYRLSDETKWPAQIHDCKAAIRWIKANADKYGIDKNRIGVWGTSAGGHLVAMLALTSESGDFKGDVGNNLNESSSITCAIDGYGPTDFLSMDDRPGAFVHADATSPESRLIGGKISEHKDRAMNASPVSWVNSACKPMLIYHGTSDDKVIVEQSDMLYELLKKENTNHIYYIKINNGAHGVRHPQLSKQMALFFQKYLFDNKEINISEKELENVPR